MKVGQKQCEDVIPSQGQTFYERWVAWAPLPWWLASLLPAALYVSMHAVLVDIAPGSASAFQDFSWFLGVIIAYVLTAVLLATRSLRALTLTLIDAFAIPRNKKSMSAILIHGLATRTMLSYGAAFGISNVLFGLAFGVWYNSWLAIASLLIGFCLAGFLCGLAVCGIVTTIRLVSHATSAPHAHVNLLHPDLCGGTAELGRVLLKYSLASLLAGILIAVYIANTGWTHRGAGFARAAIYFWIAFPHIAAIAVLLIPLVAIHRMLAAHQAEAISGFQRELCSCYTRMRASVQQASLHQVMEFCVQTIGATLAGNSIQQVRAARTWPLNVSSASKYVASYLVSLSVPVLELLRLMSSQ